MIDVTCVRYHTFIGERITKLPSLPLVQKVAVPVEGKFSVVTFQGEVAVAQVVYGEYNTPIYRINQLLNNLLEETVPRW